MGARLRCARATRSMICASRVSAPTFRPVGPSRLAAALDHESVAQIVREHDFEAGEQIVFLSNGSFLRGQIFIDLWLGDGTAAAHVPLGIERFVGRAEELRAPVRLLDRGGAGKVAVCHAAESEPHSTDSRQQLLTCRRRELPRARRVRGWA